MIFLTVVFATLFVLSLASYIDIHRDRFMQNKPMIRWSLFLNFCMWAILLTVTLHILATEQY